MSVETVAEVVQELRERVADTRARSDTGGYFAVLYLAVTEQAAAFLAVPGKFARTDLLERLTVAFYQRYANAVASAAMDGSATEPWATVFARAGDGHLTVLQHLVAAACVHIEYDLPIALSDVLSIDEMSAVAHDYKTMNVVFESLLPRVATAIRQLDPALSLPIDIVGGADSPVLGFSMRTAREAAWNAGRLRQRLPAGFRGAEVKALELLCEALLTVVLDKAGVLSEPLALLRDTLGNDVPQIIDFLGRTLGVEVPGGTRRVAVIGGGMGGLTAALCLTDPRNPQAAHTEVTVYQMGWRLGGKATTGRNLDPGMGARNQEHGLHAFFGFYENTFRVLHDVYGALNDPPFPRWIDGFEPMGVGFYWEPVHNGGHGTTWQPWSIQNLVLPGTPGDGGIGAPLPPGRTALSLLNSALTWLCTFVGTGPLNDQMGAAEIAAFQQQLIGTFVGTARDPAGSEGGSTRRLAAVAPPANVTDSIRDLGNRFKAIVSGINRRAPVDAAGDGVRHALIMMNLAAACAWGAVADGVVTNGFRVINDRDFRAWVGSHLPVVDGGATCDSALMRAIYEASFAFVNGQSGIQPGQTFPQGANIEAGTALHGVALALFAAQGAFAYKMLAGTGDTVVAPVYRVLASRPGVSFRFFHCADALQVDAANQISSVTLYRQAELGAPSYDPLVRVKGLPCWPDRPRYDQLKNGDALVGIDFEDPDGAWSRDTKVTLRAGLDYDAVILAIPPAASRKAMAAVAAVNPGWTAMYNHVKDVRTQAMQVWLITPPEDLGLSKEASTGRPMTVFWDDPAPALNVFSDFRAVLEHEDWSAEGAPRTVMYHCSTMPETATADSVVQRAEGFLQSIARTVYGPGAVDESGFRWPLLVDQRTGQHDGTERLKSQYFRANVTPSERYVLSVVGSSAFRLPAGQPGGIANLYAAGDWIDTPLNSGCMEATVMSGMLASQAISGWPGDPLIVGRSGA